MNPVGKFNNTVFEQGYMEGLKSKGTWQKVSDGIPRVYSWCWVWNGTTINMAKIVPDAFGQFVIRPARGTDIPGVTHFMLVEKPKKPEEENEYTL